MIAWIVCTIGAIAAMKFLPRGWQSVALSGAGISTWMGVGIASFFAGYRVNRKNRRRLESVEYRLCIYCLFELPAKPDEGRCPECGETYSIEAYQEIWKRRYTIPDGLE